MLLRYQDLETTTASTGSPAGTSQLRISKPLVNGAETVLNSVQVPMATVNTPFHLVGSVVGTTLTLNVDGTVDQRHGP